MPRVQIKNHRTGETIHEGLFQTVKECIEDAVENNITLDYADLSHCNLENANLDEATMNNAKFDHANLNGANLSEASLNNCTFANATLYGTCLSLSSLQKCDFNSTSFGATDIAGASICGSVFSTLSAVELNFIDTAKMNECAFHSSDGSNPKFSRPPMLIKGLAYPVILFDSHIKIGGHIKTFDEWIPVITNNVTEQIEPQLHNFIRKYKRLFFAAYHNTCFNQTENIVGLATHTTVKAIRRCH